MEGDKVGIKVTVTEKQGEPICEASVLEKPQFMLNTEYNEQMILCASQAVKTACETVYPESQEARDNLAKIICEMAILH